MGVWHMKERRFRKKERKTTGCSCVAALVAVLALQGDGFAQSKLVANLEAGKKQTVVAYGTSLTANGAWVSQLDAALTARWPGQATVINSGGSGQWSQWGVGNLERLVLQKRPDAVFIEFGINDSVARFSCPVAKSQSNLEALIDRVLAQKPTCEIILMTATPGDRYPEGHFSYRKEIASYYAMYRDVAKARGCLLVDLYPAWLALARHDKTKYQAYVPDTVHPTEEGCRNMVTPAVLDVLGVTLLGEQPLRDRTP
jgi:lysophospholipase L1-like esterase